MTTPWPFPKRGAREGQVVRTPWQKSLISPIVAVSFLLLSRLCLLLWLPGGPPLSAEAPSLLHSSPKFVNLNSSGSIVFIFSRASRLYKRVCQSVGPLVRPSLGTWVMRVFFGRPKMRKT